MQIEVYNGHIGNSVLAIVVWTSPDIAARKWNWGGGGISHM